MQWTPSLTSPKKKKNEDGVGSVNCPVKLRKWNSQLCVNMGVLAGEKKVLTCLPFPQSFLQSVGPNILSWLTQGQFLTHTGLTGEAYTL